MPLNPRHGKRGAASASTPTVATTTSTENGQSLVLVTVKKQRTTLNIRDPGARMLELPNVSMRPKDDTTGMPVVKGSIQETDLFGVIVHMHWTKPNDTEFGLTVHGPPPAGGPKVVMYLLVRYVPPAYTNFKIPVKCAVGKQKYDVGILETGVQVGQVIPFYHSTQVPAKTRLSEFLGCMVRMKFTIAARLLKEDAGIPIQDANQGLTIQPPPTYTPESIFKVREFWNYRDMVNLSSLPKFGLQTNIFAAMDALTSDKVAVSRGPPRAGEEIPDTENRRMGPIQPYRIYAGLDEPEQILARVPGTYTTQINVSDKSYSEMTVRTSDDAEGVKIKVMRLYIEIDQLVIEKDGTNRTTKVSLMCKEMSIRSIFGIESPAELAGLIHHIGQFPLILAGNVFEELSKKNSEYGIQSNEFSEGGIGINVQFGSLDPNAFCENTGLPIAPETVAKLMDRCFFERTAKFQILPAYSCGGDPMRKTPAKNASFSPNHGIHRSVWDGSYFKERTWAYPLANMRDFDVFGLMSPAARDIVLASPEWAFYLVGEQQLTKAIGALEEGVKSLPMELDAFDSAFKGAEDGDDITVYAGTIYAIRKSGMEKMTLPYLGISDEAYTTCVNTARPPAYGEQLEAYLQMNSSADMDKVQEQLPPVDDFEASQTQDPLDM